MDSSDKKDNEKHSDNIPIPGSGTRARNDSESSASGGETNKRQKIAQQFVSGIVGASPPKFVSLEEIMQAANGMTNMSLVHEIAVDTDFKLKPVDLPEDSIHKKVKETMKRAFWDLLKEQLAEDPPDFSQALVLLEDIKKGLFALLLPQHTKIKQQINEVLDSTLIKQQVDAGTLDFKNYASYVISVMAKLCAPVRDERIKELTETENVVETFKGILETLDLMKLDMANFAIDVARPDIIAQSVEYERQKFAEFLKIQTDGLAQTRAWLLRHLPTDVNEGVSSDDRTIRIRHLTTQVLSNAYMELLEWNDENVYPETIMLDVERIIELSRRIKNLVTAGSVLLLTMSAAVNLQSDTHFKENIKKQLMIILEDVNMENNEEFQGILQNISDQMVKQTNDTLKQQNLNTLSQELEITLRGQINEIYNQDHKIRTLIGARVRDFLHQIISSPTAAPQKFPPGLSFFQKELTIIAGNFLRIVSHNRSVFGQYYIDIVDAALPYI